jgi:streptogramin lyase
VRHPTPQRGNTIGTPNGPAVFDGGGYRAGGKAMFDSEGNLWVADNWTVGWQGQDSLWQGNATKFAPNGRPISPMTTGFAGGGMQFGPFGTAVDAKDNAWFTNYGSKAIAVFDKNGKPLTPADGINFDGRLGLMQGIIVTPSGDVWALGIEKSQLVHFPNGDLTKGRIVCEGDKQEPCKSFRAPFHLGIDQQDRIWASRASPPLIRARPRTSRPGLTIAVLASTARATYGSPTGSVLGY